MFLFYNFLCKVKYNLSEPFIRKYIVHIRNKHVMKKENKKEKLVILKGTSSVTSGKSTKCKQRGN